MSIHGHGIPADQSSPGRLEPITDACASGGCSSSAAPPESRDPQWHRAAGAARALSWVSLVWMTGEGILGLVAGFEAGSISLVGWALGSAIEGLASVIVIWRFTGGRTLSEPSEARAGKAVAVSFFLLAPYIAVQAAAVLVGLALTAAVGWWWLDPIVGLALAALAVYEGVEAWRGEDCC